MAFRNHDGKVVGASKLTLPPGKSEVHYFDDECTGLSVRLQGAGRTWVVWYSVNGARRRMKIGDVAAMPLKEARIKAGGIVNGARDGKDALAEREVAKAKAAETFGALLRLYLERRAKPRQRPRTYAETERYLLHRWAPLHDRPIDAITRRDLANRQEQIRLEHGPGAAEKARVYLGMAYSWAMKQGLAESNPALGLEVTPANRRDRVLSEAELRAVWLACGELGDFGAMVRLLMLTGARRDEVSGLSWQEIEGTLWTLPGARSKNGRQHEVPLSRQAMALIEGRSGPFLFGRDRRGPFSGYSRAKARLDKLLGDMPGWTLHDIRRSTVTHMAEMGIEPHVIEAVVNHVSGHKGGVAGIYNKASYRPQKVAALQRWADWLESVVEGKEMASNVRALGRVA